MPQALKTELITTALSQNRSGSFAAVLGSFARACALIVFADPPRSSVGLILSGADYQGIFQSIGIFVKRLGLAASVAASSTPFRRHARWRLHRGTVIFGSIEPEKFSGALN